MPTIQENKDSQVGGSIKITDEVTDFVDEAQTTGGKVNCFAVQLLNTSIN